MKFLGTLPWQLELDDQALDAAAFQTEASDGNACEFASDTEGIRKAGPCHPSNIVIGTSDSFEPKFCPTHYFYINDGDGKSNYKIVPLSLLKN